MKDVEGQHGERVRQLDAVLQGNLAKLDGKYRAKIGHVQEKIDACEQKRKDLGVAELEA